VLLSLTARMAGDRFADIPLAGDEALRVTGRPEMSRGRLVVPRQIDESARCSARPASGESLLGLEIGKRWCRVALRRVVRG
jgi:hypothetical protein